MSEERDIITTSTPPGFDSLARPKMMHQRSDFESPRSNLTNNQQQKRAPSFNDDDIVSKPWGTHPYITFIIHSIINNLGTKPRPKIESLI